MNRIKLSDIKWLLVLLCLPYDKLNIMRRKCEIELQFK